MKILMAIALVMASLTSMAQAAPQKVDLACTVITNGNRTNWENVTSFNKTVDTSETFNELEFDVNSKYGDKFTVQVSLVISGSVILSVSSDIPGTNAMIYNKNSGELDELDVNDNIVSTDSTFALKKTPKYYVTYSVSCIVK
jgi:hypothetical protein